ncbi:hypothetical protein B0I35DRAFT_447666 [Stachybotrys elegans]|uniref:Uncharacterized protein n=1 Tax=Stachybotrys elegans TaxID=80388 RepID=A0A8K0SCG2_9HYPO|nr:hypothetical protein B0I35DRAFT_447666 [Stachybotrys elegans]
MDPSTASSIWSLALTPTTSESGTFRGTVVTPRQSSVREPTVALPSGPIRVTTLNVSSWPPCYPVIGQFAMTNSEEVVAAGPDGLFSFKRVHDHVSKPWSSPRPFPETPLDSSSISGIALHEDKHNKRLDVFCIANGNLYSFSRSASQEDAKGPASFVADFGTPCVATTLEVSYGSYTKPHRYSLVVPSQSGGLLHTSTTGPKIQSTPYCSDKTKTEWEPVEHVATHLGIISAVTIVALDTSKSASFGFFGSVNNWQVDIVAVCIAQGRLHSVEGPFTDPTCRSYSSPTSGWKGNITKKIHHPGEVTGNPVLLQRKPQHGQLDFLVPSAAGGVFHFVRTPSTPDEWHMIRHVGFPSSLPAAGSLAFYSPRQESPYDNAKLGAALQIGGRLYTIQTLDGRSPWFRCQLYPVERPGPSYN